MDLTSSELPENVINAFKHIVNFVKDIYHEFGRGSKGLSSYNFLLDKTGLTHGKAILRHIGAFSEFFDTNRVALEARDPSKLVEDSRVVYSEKAYIELAHYLQIDDAQTTNVIWHHLYTIWNLLEPSPAKEAVLNTLKEASTPEEQFINNILGKVEKVVSGTNLSSNPMSAVMGLLSSGVLSDVMNGMRENVQSGNLDMGKMIGTMSKMASRLTGGGGIKPEIVPPDTPAPALTVSDTPATALTGVKVKKTKKK